MTTAAIAMTIAGAGVQPPCAIPPGWNAVEAKRPQFVIFGEVHGTKEAPDLVGSIACALARKGQRVLVAVELSSSTDAQLQRLWSTPVADFPKRVISELPGFAGRQDGVASVAMLQLLDRLHSLSQSGKTVDVVAFNGSRTAAQVQRWRDLPAQGPREAAQAENIATAAALHPYDRVLVLTGNFHAQRLTADWSGVKFDPMARRLKQSGPLLSLNQEYAGGSFWNCIRRVADGQRDCGQHEAGKSRNRGGVHIALLARGAAEPPQPYDGIFWFPIVHGSPPASGANPN